jgi:hypothetical protein
MSTTVAVESPMLRSNVNTPLTVDKSGADFLPGIMRKASTKFLVERTDFINEEWDKIIPVIDSIISHIQYEDLVSEEIIQLIQLTSKFEKTEFKDSLLYDLVMGLNALFKEIFVNLFLNKALSLEYIERSKNLLEFAQALKTEDEPDPGPMKDLKLKEVDRFNNHSVFKVD